MIASDVAPDAVASGSKRRSPRDWGVAVLPLGLVGIAAAFNLWVLRAELLPVPYGNDMTVHLMMVRWATQQVHAGRIPLDGWFGYLQLGGSFFHHYQSLPAVITGILGAVVGATTAFHWSLYLLPSLWPFSVYWGARLLGWERWPAAVAALVSPLLVSASQGGFDYQAYVWHGYGVWAQLWGMWLMPLALGLSWRAISGKGGYALAAASVALTIACHFLVGYLVVLIIGVLVVSKPADLLRRLARGTAVGLGGALTAAWVLVPLLVDRPWMRSIQLAKDTSRTSFGARIVIGGLLRGQVFDSGRFPVVTVLVGVGIVVCARRWRMDERARILLGIFVLSLVLFCGTSTLGPLVKLLPGSGDLLFERFIIGVHMAGILLAGVGGAWLAGALYSAVRRGMPRLTPAVVGSGVLVIGLCALAPAWLERASYEHGGAVDVRVQLHAPGQRAAEGLIAEAKAAGGGRIYGGSLASMRRDELVGGVFVGKLIADGSADGIGYTLRVDSLSSDIETEFDDTNPVQYNLLAIRYLLLADTSRPKVPATLLDRKGGWSLWKVPTTGYFQVVDTSGTITANRTDLTRKVTPFLTSPELAKGIFPEVAFAGRPAGVQTLPLTPGATGPAGTVSSTHVDLANGVFGARVVANRLAVVLLKSSYDPHWQALVDGKPQPTQMVAPSFVGVAVPAGAHTVSFRYIPITYYPELFAIAALCLLALAGVPPLYRRRKSRATVNSRQAAHDLEEVPAPASAITSSVFVVIPAYNEEGSLGTVLADLFDHDRQARVVVVDDASTDRTGEVARAFPVTVLRHTVNLGQGAALKTGIDFALHRGADIIVTFDADGQMEAADVPSMVEPVRSGRYDVALGTRFAGVQAQGMTHGRQLFLHAAILFTRTATRLPLSDAHNGFRVFSREAALQIQITQNRMAHASQILSELARLNLRWVEIPVSIRYSTYSRAKGQSPFGAVDVVMDLLQSPRR